MTHRPRVTHAPTGDEDGSHAAPTLAADVSQEAPLGAPSCQQEASDDHEPCFLELFAGAGGLTAAVKRMGVPVRPALDVAGKGIDADYADLMDDKVFRNLLKAAKRGRIRWLHGGPPCKTFTRARRKDKHGRARTLRSDQHPDGLPGVRDARLVEGNLLAKRFAQIARAVHRAGGWWSLENPARSVMWDFTPVARLRQLPDVQLLIGDQCCFGGVYRKPTGWLTNAPFLRMLACTCPGEPAHPRHPVLEGRTFGPDGCECWLTSLASE